MERSQFFKENINQSVVKRYTVENTVCTNLFELKLEGTFLITANIVGTISDLYYLENERVRKGDTICTFNYLGVCYSLSADFDLMIIKSYQNISSVIEWGAPIFLIREDIMVAGYKFEKKIKSN